MVIIFLLAAILLTMMMILDYIKVSNEDYEKEYEEELNRKNYLLKKVMESIRPGKANVTVIKV